MNKQHKATIWQGESGADRWCYRITGPRLTAPVEGARLGRRTDIERHVRAIIRRLEKDTTTSIWTRKVMRKSL
jgi:hypothetical protein